MKFLYLFFVGLCLFPGIAQGVQPAEMLSDPQLEARARSISAGLRCLVCQNQSIDDSDAELAHDLRLLVRQRLQAGDSDDAVRGYLVARYGDYVLLKPPFNLATLALWCGPIVLLLIGCGFAVAMVVRRAPPTQTLPLSEQEQQKLQALLQRKDQPSSDESPHT